MVQFNLLPAVKLEYIKAQRIKHLMILVSIIASAAAIVLLLIMFTTVNIVQKKSLSDLNKDVTKYSNTLKGTKDLDKILTVQNQLNTLDGLHDSSPVSSRLFGFMSQVTPTQASITDLKVDFTAKTMTITGNAASLDTIGTFTDTLKAATYTQNGKSTGKHAFTGVVLTAFAKNSEATKPNEAATFTIDMQIDPTLFVATSDITLVLPNTVSTNQGELFGTGN